VMNYNPRYVTVAAWTLLWVHTELKLQRQTFLCHSGMWHT
jgi:hypothetical protein